MVASAKAKSLASPLLLPEEVAASRPNVSLPAAPAIANRTAFPGPPAPAPSAPLLGSVNLSKTSTTPPTEQFQTEISTTVSIGGKFLVISSGGGSTLQVSDATNAATIFGPDADSSTPQQRIDLGSYVSQSVASYGNLLAVALSPADYATNGGKGVIRFYRVAADGSVSLVKDVTVGYLPDSIAFNEQGTKLVIANEGEPIAGYATDPSKDPAGSIGIIDIQGRVNLNFTYTELGFAGLTLPTGIRLSGPAGRTPNQATDIEPEYVSILGNYAYVTLQENNGVAKVNLITNTIEKIFALGTVDYKNQLVDLTDKDGGFKPLLGQAYEGLRMPDGIAAYSVKGKDYFVTANEGDGREYGTQGTADYYTDEVRNPRVKTLADDTKVGSSDRITTFGGRSISIFDADTGALLWDSGNTLQTIAVAAGMYDDLRSDDKGVEPEGVVVAKLNGRTYAIVGMERTKSSMLAVFDVTDPSAGRFITSTVIAGSISPEGLEVVEAKQSPTGRTQLIVSNEVSNTLNVFDLEALIAAPPVAGAGTFAGSMLKDVGAPDLKISNLITNGEFTNGLTPGSSVYAPTGIFDGIGAYDNGDGTYTVLVNSELGASVGYQYQVGYAAVAGAATTPVNVTGARINKFIVDKDIDDDASNGYQSRILSGGLAYSTVIGSDNNGFDRFCSSTLFQAGQFGGGRGFTDRLYITGEESSAAPGGSNYALDTATGVLYQARSLGRAAFENVALVDTGNAGTVGLVMFDDTTAPLYLWVGTKNAASSDFLDRNGLAKGNLYVWKPNVGVIPEAGSDSTLGPDSDDLKAIATGTTLAGSWVLLGDQDFAASKSATELRTAAITAGAMQFSRPEDGDTNPLNGKQVVFNTTGSSAFGNADAYGNVITLDFTAAFAANGLLNGSGSTALKVIYDGDKLADPTAGLRSPDNLVWSADGSIYIQEDRTVSPWGTVDGSIWKLNPTQVDPLTGQAVAERWAVIQRQTPYGQTDTFAAVPSGLGEWETSGIVDVSALYGALPGSYFLSDVQAHGLKDGNLNGAGYLVEGGQLNLIQQTPPLI